ncbi:MAG: hypothetical protein IJW45_02295 [Oscillospiraceae bacterium]|nr:hypothetical protein [Oscillospiraceae bacterium]
MTKRKWRWIVGTLVFAILAGLWTWRYCKTQAEFAPLIRPSSVEYYEMDETVSIGPITAYKEDVLTGYSFCVDESEIMDYDAFLERFGADDPLTEKDNIPDKILLLTVTVRNEDNSVSDFSLFKFKCHGTGASASFRRELLKLVAPELEDVTLDLALGDEITVMIPYELRRDQFSDWSWWHLDDFEMYLSILEITEEYDLRRAVKVNG